MSAKITTYHSLNSDEEKQWLAYIDLPKGRLHISFTAPTEEEVKEKVRTFWKAEKAKIKGRQPKQAKTEEQEGE